MTPEEEAFLKVIQRTVVPGEPKKYSISMNFDDQVEDSAETFSFGPQTSSVILEKDFYLKKIECIIRYTATSSALSTQQINTVGNNAAPYFNGDVVFRDRREWCQGTIPLGLFLPDFGAPLTLPTASKIPGRTEIFATVYPSLAQRIIAISDTVTVESYTLTFFLSGWHAV